ncbi:MAG: alpha-glucosidase/alpha-galactosidase [Planctomycetes bacterium]|nr:alpha-glucosidase/alpha-galactosidase [Planctomycetota bacterium]
MERKPVLVAIGAGSITFTPKLLRDMLCFAGLGGSTLRLVDIDGERLGIMAALAERLTAGMDEPWTIESFTDRKKALPGADYVIISVDVNRVETWASDWRIPVELGIRQVTGELGGPGGLFHSLRQIPIHLEIAHDIAALCPAAIVMVESNPLNRICLAMERYSDCGEVLGLCHGVEIAQNRLGRVLDLATEDFLATAAGVNHFTWILDLRHRETGEDLYPALKTALKTYDPDFWPLSRKLFDIFGYMPSPGDDHIGEYLPYAWELVGLEGPGMDERGKNVEESWERYREIALGDKEIKEFRGTGAGVHVEERVEFFFTPRNWTDTLAFPIMNAIETRTFHRMPAVNMVNRGAINNLPADAFVECPAAVDASGCRLLAMGNLPKPLAALCRRDVDAAELTVEAAVTGDRNLVLQAMLLDPVVDSVRNAEKVLDAMLEANAKYLPQFA